MATGIGLRSPEVTRWVTVTLAVAMSMPAPSLVTVKSEVSDDE
jgi:hypothetical protein